MKNYFDSIRRHWKTSVLGIAVIGWGIWLAHVTYVPMQTLAFNLQYVWAGPEAFILAGLIGIHAKDHDK